MLLAARHHPRRLAGTLLSAVALLGGTMAVPAEAHRPVVRAHIALGCQTASHRHHQRHGNRCQARLQGRLVLAHAA